MQALVLAGGEGTRLRPLTLTTPKPVMPLAGRPFLTFMLSWLSRHGVDDAILSCGHLSDEVERVLGDEYEGVRLHHVVEEERLDTAGPVRLAYDQGLLQERFLVMNGDCLADLDLTAELRQHEATRAACTLALVEVEDTSHYGVVPAHPDGQVEAFLEKQPGPVPTNRINAGAYVLERSVVEHEIPAGRPFSFERDVFPKLVGNGLYGWHADGYWIDIGTPERYLEATYDLLAGRVESTLPPRDETDSLIPETCITVGARIGPLSVLGEHCSVGDRAFVERSVLHDSVLVGPGAHIEESVIGSRARIGEGARVGRDAIVGAGAEIAPGAIVGEGVRIEPAEKVAR
jgi:mannose-1-phosphate guanylyltransferase